MTFDALAGLQLQVVHRHQLLRAGTSASAIQRRLASGEWQRLLPAVYALFPDEYGPRHRLIATLLYAGADAQLAGPTALRVHGLRDLGDSAAVHVLVPHHRQLGSVDFAVLHRTTRLGAPRRIGRFPVCPLERALADTARWGAREPELRTILGEAVARRLVTVEAVHAELAGSRRNRTAGLRLALAELAGSGPGAEAELRGTLMQSRILPRVVWRPRLRTADGRVFAGPMAWIADAALGVEVDIGGDLPPAAQDRAEARQNLLAGYGALVLRFAPSRLHDDPIAVRRMVERAYLQRRYTSARIAIEPA